MSRRIIAGVPKSESVYSATNNEPAAIPLTTRGKITLNTLCVIDIPKVRAAFTMLASKLSRDERVVIITKGKVYKVITMAAPLNPYMGGVSKPSRLFISPPGPNAAYKVNAPI